MHSGQGEEGSADNRPPLPREPQAPSVSEPREGIVLPSKGGRWVPPSQARRPEQDRWEQPAPAVQPAAGQPWGAPQAEQYPQQQPPQAQQPQVQPLQGPPPQGQLPQGQLPPAYGQEPAPQPGYAHPDDQSTRMMGAYDGQSGQQYPGQQHSGQYQDPQYGGGYDPSYGGAPMMSGGDADQTRMMAPYGQQQPAGGDADHTQLLAPYNGQSVDLLPQPEETRQPLPPEQEFHAPVPPIPQSPPPGIPPEYQQQQSYQPPMPSGAPFAIRPGTPAEDAAQQFGQGDPAPATQQLPRFGDGGWPPAQQQQMPQEAVGPQPAPQQPEDYDYLYRKDDDPAGARQPRQGAVAAPAFSFPQHAPPQQPPQRQEYGHGGPGGPGGRYDGHGGGHDGPPPARRKPSTAVMVGIGVAVLALIGIGAGAALSGGGSGGKPDSGSSATAGAPGNASADPVKAQAQQLNALLRTSNSSRTSVINAVAAIKACRNLDGSATDLRTAAGERSDLVSKLSQMTLDQLPDSADLISQLTAAWKASASADNYYAGWADQVAKPKGCHKGHARVTVDVQRGNLASGQATVAKQKAAALWNPIARQYGLTQRQFTQL